MIELLETVQPWIERKEIAALRVSTRPDYIDQQRVALLQRYQVATVELGVQSMNDQVLSLAKRGHSSADVEQAVPRAVRDQFGDLRQALVAGGGGTLAVIPLGDRDASPSGQGG